MKNWTTPNEQSAKFLAISIMGQSKCHVLSTILLSMCLTQEMAEMFLTGS